jgi:hypothetical protein
MKESLGIRYIVRYMDDIIILLGSKEHLRTVKEAAFEYIQDNLMLEIKPNWQIFPVDCHGVDFVGFRFFHGFVLLRKRTCKAIKSRSRKIRKKMEKGQLINYTEFCSVNSYKGWVKLCNGHRLAEKYITPLQPSIDWYYAEVISKKKKGGDAA